MKPTIVARGAPAPTLDPPPYLAPVFDSPDLRNRATAIVDLLSDEDEDTALAALAWLAEHTVGWSRQILDAAGWMLLNPVAFTVAAPAPIEAEWRAAA